MKIIGRETAYHHIKAPELLKPIYDVVKRSKYKADLNKLYRCWKRANTDGENGRYRVYLEVDRSAAVYAYDWGKKLRVCSVDLKEVNGLIAKIRKGQEHGFR